MTIYDAISRADELRNNKIEEAVKVAMLSELDGRIDREILRPYGGAGAFVGYDANNLDTELLVPQPYDALYVTYLEAEICRLNSEIPKYNAARNVFSEKYEAFKAWYVRNHTYNTPNIKFPTRRY